MGVVLVYGGLLATALGFVSMVRPTRRLGNPTRRRAALVLVLGLGVGFAGAALPAPVRRSAGSRLIDRFMPEYHFNEVHSVRIQAPPDRIFRAVQAVTPREVRWLHTLVWIRSLPARILGRTVAPTGMAKPLLGSEPGTGSVRLGEVPDRELLIGLAGSFWKPAGGPRPRIEGPQEFLDLDRPDYAKATMGFWLQDEGAGWYRLTTETRVFTADASTRRAFAAYWRLIYPGSALLRRTFLAAVKRRAEGASSGTSPLPG